MITAKCHTVESAWSMTDIGLCLAIRNTDSCIVFKDGVVSIAPQPTARQNGFIKDIQFIVKPPIVCRIGMLNNGECFSIGEKLYIVLNYCDVAIVAGYRYISGVPNDSQQTVAYQIKRTGQARTELIPSETIVCTVDLEIELTFLDNKKRFK